MAAITGLRWVPGAYSLRRREHSMEDDESLDAQDQSDLVPGLTMPVWSWTSQSDLLESAR